MNVRLSGYSMAMGDSVVLRIDYRTPVGELSSLGLNIVEIGEADFTSWMRAGAEILSRGEEIEAKFNLSDFFKPGAVYEIRSLELSDVIGTVVTFIGGRDFSPVLFRVKASADEPTASAEEVAADARRKEEERERLYDSPLGDPEGAGAVGFKVLMFVERVMLTRPLRVPGVQLLPLRTGDRPAGNASTDEANVISGVLWQLGWQVSVDAEGWVQATSRERPITVMHVPRVFAASEEEALYLARQKRDRLLDLMALHRGSYGVPFATAVQPLTGSQEERYAATRFYPEVESFEGNMLGGVVSGESPKVWLDHDRAVISNPFVALCLSLFKEAQGETDLDFAYFRYWNLLEVIAYDRVEGGVPVLDFEGRELREGRKKATTSGAQGRVYELLKRVMLRRNYVERHFGRPLPEGLWDAVQVWYACQNAAAHYGKFRPEDPVQRDRPWYSLALKAY